MNKHSFLRIVLSLYVSISAFNVRATDMEYVDLPKPQRNSDMSVKEAISKRRSIRHYSSQPLTTEQIGQLLWACQGITDKKSGLRAAPSAGACYPLEIYIIKDDGLFHYIPKTHQLEKKSDKNLKQELAKAAWRQPFIAEAPVSIVICAVYERVISRYGKRGNRYTEIEVGHAAENVHLQAVALGLSSVPVGAFNDDEVSKILKLPDNEKPIYIIPVGYMAE